MRVIPECDEGSRVEQIDVGQALQVQADGQNHFFVVQCLQLNNYFVQKHPLRIQDLENGSLGHGTF